MTRPAITSGWWITGLLVSVLVFLPEASWAASTGMQALTVTTGPGGTQTYSVTLQILLLMTVLSMLPAALLMMTSFTRIIIVLALLRQALGTMQTPSNQTLIGLALFLTFFIMAPVFDKAYEEGVKPYLDEKIEAQEALQKVLEPFRVFMTEQTRESDIEMFASIAGEKDYQTVADVPMKVLIPAYVTSELKTAFQIGFLIFIPFLIIDLVVASVLMAMGMMMLSPMMISLPFKIMLFVLVDGWAMIMGTLASSFHIT